MPSATMMMKLPAARAGQVKALGAAKGIGATEALEHLLNRSIEAGEIADVLPGFEVTREGSAILLRLDGHEVPAMSEEIALVVADNLEHAGGAQVAGKGRQSFYGHQCMFIIGRHGSGVVVVHEEVAAGGQFGNGKRTLASLTRGMAVDLARQIRNATAGH